MYTLRFLLMTLVAGCAATLLAIETPGSGKTINPLSMIPVELDQHTLDKRINPILADLALANPAKEVSVRAALELHLQALQTWHSQNHTKLTALWEKWADARTTETKDEAKAEAVGREIDAIYASFQFQHAATLSHLATELSPGQIDTVKDSMTKSPGLKRTYNAYLEIVPQATDADKKFFWDTLLVAREKAMDAITNKEKADQFKRQKVLIEAYIDSKGYDWKKSYAAYAERLKVQAAKGK